MKGLEALEKIKEKEIKDHYKISILTKGKYDLIERELRAFEILRDRAQAFKQDGKYYIGNYYEPGRPTEVDRETFKTILKKRSKNQRGRNDVIEEYEDDDEDANIIIEDEEE